jgi:CcmD family protein
MTHLNYLGIAYAVAWIGISAYLLSLSRRQRALEKRLKDLQSEKPQAPN